MNKFGYCLFLLTYFFNASVSAQENSRPEENRFTKVILAQRLEEPMQFDVLTDGRVIFAERKGKLKLYDPKTKKVTVIAEIPVSTKYVSKTGEITEGEDGLQGVILDPAYEKNHWIYLYYSPKDGDPKNILVRYEWQGNKLNTASKKIILEVPVQREECCHVGGGMLFDKQGNLFLTTGDNTFSRSSDGFTPLDERPGESPRDAQKSSGNTNDLRGKILRIHPEPDGSYTIPEGNLFPRGQAQTKPEIYTMGNRNPWRLTIDSKTGWLYWGEVGPDGSVDKEGRGPKAYDEFNIAKQSGNYGWPYFVADNKAYWDYDFATQKSGEKFDPAHPVNNSPNNTGKTSLPPATPAMIWYPYAASEEFPLLESGGRSATGGPIYHRSDFKNPARPYPAYYEGKWFVTDWVRGWIMAITLDENGYYRSMERFLPALQLKGAIDMKFGPDGSLYVLEYGNGYFKDNPEAELIRIEYNGGNRKPIVQAAADRTAGALPFKVGLSSQGTMDYDHDSLKYQWRITRNGAVVKSSTAANPSVTLTAAGEYKATLTVTDKAGAKNSKTVTLFAGNEPPRVKINFLSGNKSFYFPQKTISYAVSVTDREDGSLDNKKIPASQVAVSIDYLSEGFDLTEIAQAQRSVDASVQHARAINLINKSDCKACHAIRTKSLGPNFTAVATRYKGKATAVEPLAFKIIKGGSGVWGDAMMPAHPALSENDAKAIVRYIMSLGEKAQPVKSKPVKGSYAIQLPADDKGRGSFIFRAAYTDRGSKTAAPQSSEDIVVLKNPLVPVAEMEVSDGMEFRNNKGSAVIKGRGQWVAMKNIDLTGIRQLECITGQNAGLKDRHYQVQVHLDSPDGRLVGTSAENIVSLDSASGFHDVYLVFQQSGSEETTLPLRAVRFAL